MSDVRKWINALPTAHLRSVGHDAHLVERGLSVEEHNIAVLHVPLHDVSNFQVLRQLFPHVLDEQLLHEPVASVQPHLNREFAISFNYVYYLGLFFLRGRVLLQSPTIEVSRYTSFWSKYLLNARGFLNLLVKSSKYYHFSQYENCCMPRTRKLFRRVLQ